MILNQAIHRALQHSSYLYIECSCSFLEHIAIINGNRANEVNGKSLIHRIVADIPYEECLESIEHEPGEKWKKITFEIVKYLVLAAVGVAAGYFIKG